MGAIGGIIDATQGDKTRVVAKTKNQDIQDAIDAGLDIYNSRSGAEQNALDKMIATYLGQQGQFETDIGQERGAVDQFYNGQMESKLGRYRADRAKAINAAADVAVAQARANVNRSRLGSEGSGSSYDQRLAIGATLPIRTQAALDIENQKRADLGYLTENQLGLAGRRATMAKAVADYGLVPYNTAAQIQGRNLGLLSGITNLDQANKFYGLKSSRSKWANIADSLDAGILNAAAIYGAVGGGMGAKRGGLVWPMSYEDGGEVHGPGTEHSDSIPARLSKGEFVMPASAVKLPGVLPLLHHIRRMGLASEGVHGEPMRVPGHYEWGGEEGDMMYDFAATYPQAVGAGDQFPGAPGPSGDGWDGGGGGGGNRGGGGGGGGGKKGMGGGGGGLAGSAQQLLSKVDASLHAQFQPATMVPTSGGPMGAPPVSYAQRVGFRSRQRPAGDLTDEFMQLYGPKAVPSNFGELPQAAQREYIDSYARARELERIYGPGSQYE